MQLMIPAAIPPIIVSRFSALSRVVSVSVIGFSYSSTTYHLSGFLGTSMELCVELEGDGVSVTLCKFSEDSVRVKVSYHAS